MIQWSRRSILVGIAAGLCLTACERAPDSPTTPPTTAERRTNAIPNGPVGWQELEVSEEEPDISPERVQEIWASAEVQRVLELQTEFVRRVDAANASGVSLDELRSAAHVAVAEGDDSRLAELLFESREEADRFTASIREARTAVVEAFPEVAAARDDLEPSACTLQTRTVDTFFDRFDAIRDARLDPTGDGEARNKAAPTCGSYWKQLKLLACAGLCSASTAGVGTVLCGWGCWCTFCTTNSAVGAAIC